MISSMRVWLAAIRRCPRCLRAANHTGTYCQRCGEPL